MDVSILVFQGCIALPVVGCMEVLRQVGDRYQAGRPGVPHPYRVRLVGVRPDAQGIVHATYGFPVRCDAGLDDDVHADLVLVPAFEGDVVRQLGENAACVPWIRQQYERGADVATICTGAFALAETGLLDGLTATTHWAAASLLAARYPRVQVQPQHIVVDHGRLCTSGAATSFLNLLVHLVRRHLGAEVAEATARFLLVDLEKPQQGAWANLRPPVTHGDEAVARAQAWIDGHLADDLVVADLARRVHVSVRTFIRRFKAATGTTPLDYVQRTRVDAARRLLSSSRRSIPEVAEDVGYRDVAAFRRIFARETGLTPSAWRERNTPRSRVG